MSRASELLEKLNDALAWNLSVGDYIKYHGRHGSVLDVKGAGDRQVVKIKCGDDTYDINSNDPDLKKL